MYIAVYYDSNKRPIFLNASLTSRGLLIKLCATYGTPYKVDEWEKNHHPLSDQYTLDYWYQDRHYRIIYVTDDKA